MSDESPALIADTSWLTHVLLVLIFPLALLLLAEALTVGIVTEEELVLPVREEALVGGEGVVMGVSSSSRGLIGGVLITPPKQSSALSLRSSSESSGLLKLLIFRECGLPDFSESLRFLVLGSDMPKSIALVPLELDAAGIGEVRLRLLLVSFLGATVEVGVVGSVAGCDLPQAGVFSALSGSRLMVKPSKLECPFTASKWLLCPFSVGLLLELLLWWTVTPLVEALPSCCACGSD